jgi:hypothetical protein
MTGYSATPLGKKLGIKEGFRVSILGTAPLDLDAKLAPLPPDVKIHSKLVKELDVVLMFSKELKDLEKRFIVSAAKIVSNGMIWVAWPKKASKVATDLNFDVVQNLGLDAGLVDVKICAIDEIWSGLKFVIRVKDREKS